MSPLSTTADRLVTDDGRVFPYIADTAWELFHRATPDEVDRYLDDRAAKGFTVIQAVVLAELGGESEPNHAGELALIDQDPTRPNPAYMDFVEDVIRRCGERGLRVALLPTWGSFVLRLWGNAPILINADNARAFGTWIGARFGHLDHLIWVLGGDRPPVHEGVDYRPVWREMAAGIKAAEQTPHLMSYHPKGKETSADHLAGEDWLDFHMCQSGHHRADPGPAELIRRMKAADPGKPCLDAEPCYEDHPMDFDPDVGWFDAGDVEAAIRAGLEAGGAGFAYGAHPIWQWFDHGREPVSHVRRPWHEALDLPGSSRVAELGQLIARSS
ncbi:MAG: DUF4038 domain-containing protein [Planctomycetota bacterium]